MKLYCTAPILDCDDQQTLQDYTYMDCIIENKKRVGGRIYLAAACFNAFMVIITTLLFIYCASGKLKSPIQATSKKEFRKMCKRYSLQKRSVAATTLGAVGHFIFSTSVFLTQAFNNAVGCQLILWSVIIGFYTWIVALIIRAYRLRFLFRLNQLKVKYLKMSTAERSTCINDKDYRWYLVNVRHKDAKLRRPYIIYAISLVVIIVVTIPAEICSMRRYGTCIVRWGAATLVAYCGVFVILAPFIYFGLRNIADAHGIRTEIFVDVCIAMPFFILYYIWFFLSSSDDIHLAFYVHKAFGPGNWVVFFTIVSHIASVVVPVFHYYYTPNENNIFNRAIRKMKRCYEREKRRSSRSTIEVEENELQSPNPVVRPELSIESLERSLADPDLMVQLQDLAIRDFSSENVLFYNRYLKLEEAFKNEIIKKRFSSSSLEHGVPSRKWINSITNTIPSKVAGEEDESNNLNLEQFLLLPIPYTMIQDFIRTYEMYIQIGAPNQVNISYRARMPIDEVFENIYTKYPELRLDKSIDRLSFYNSNQENSGSEEASKVQQRAVVEHNEAPPILNFGVFEAARKEVCWNIFNSVYPYLVNMYRQEN